MVKKAFKIVADVAPLYSRRLEERAWMVYVATSEPVAPGANRATTAQADQVCQKLDVDTGAVVRIDPAHARSAGAARGRLALAQSNG